MTYQYGEETLGSEIVIAGEKLANVPADPEKPDTTHDWELRYYVGEDEINIATFVATGDTTIVLKYIDVTVPPVGETATVLVWNGTGYEEREVTFEEGTTLYEVLDQLPAWTGDETTVGGGESYEPHFFRVEEDGIIEMSDEIPGETPVEAAGNYIVLYYPDYLEVTGEDGEEVFAELTTDAEGNWTVEIADALTVDENGNLEKITDSENPNRFVLTLDTETSDFADADSLTVRYGDGAKMEISGALMDTRQQSGNERMRLSIRPVIGERVFDSSADAAVPFVDAPAKEVYELELFIHVTDEDEIGVKISDFEGGMAVTIKPVRVKALQTTDGWKTGAYILEGRLATSDDLKATVSEQDGTVTFYPPHFTEVALVNEYYLDVVFEGSVEEGTVSVGGKSIVGGMIPEGATLKAVTPAISAEDEATNLISGMSNNAGKLTIGNDLVMTSAPMTLTVTTEPKTITVDINGRETEAPIGSVQPVEITLQPGEQLAALPEGAVLLDIIEKDDGSRVLVFAVSVTPGMPPITYSITSGERKDYYVTNGIIGDEQEGVEYKTTKDTQFYSGTYHLEVRDTIEKAKCWLWLWILLIILLIIAILAILYLIVSKNTRDREPNAFEKIILAIGHGFAMLCLGVYLFFTGKAFRKE